MTLVWLILVPLLGGLLSWQAERFSATAPRWIALASATLSFTGSVWLWVTQDFSLTGAGFASLSSPDGALPQWTLQYRAEWIPAIGASFHLGLDGLSLLMVALTSLLGVLAIAAEWRDAGDHPGFFHLNLLWNIGGVTGIFLALDLLLFFFFWEMMLVPMYFLIAMRGHGAARQAAAMKFVIYTQASGLLLLVAILGLVHVHHASTGILSFNYHDLLGTPMSADTGWFLMLGFFIAFAVKLPVVPLHGWLADAHTHAPASGAADLAGLLMKTGAYGFLRFGIPLFPDASREIAPLAMWLGVIGVVYGALVAFSQNDIKRLVAYTGISHMGFVMIGIFAGTGQALAGVVVQMIAHALSAGALFILCGELQERFGTRDLRRLGGLDSRATHLPRLLLFFAMATLGLPGLGNFVGEFLILSGTFVTAPWVTIAASSGLVLAVAYSLIMVQRVLHGDDSQLPALAQGHTADLSRRELAMAGSLVLLLVALGLYPQTVIDTARAPVQATVTLADGVAPVPGSRNSSGDRP